MSLMLCTYTSAHAGPVKISDVEAKSYYDSGPRYPATKVKDGYVATQWFEGDRGNGLGAWIRVDLGAEKTVTKVVLYAGDWKSQKDWQRANRPKELEVKFSDETTEIWTLTDEWKPQIFVPSKPKATSSIRFKIYQIYNGTAFPDTAISEILVFDDKSTDSHKVTSATASSEFPADQDGTYDASQLTDGIKDTFWCENNKDGDGVGEWIELDFGSAKKMSKAVVTSGPTAPTATRRIAVPSTL